MNGPAKSHVCAILGLTEGELNELVSLAGVDAVEEFCATLEDKLIPERIPAVIRRGDASLGGRTLLDLLRSEGIEGFRDYLERLFSYLPE